MPAPLFIAAAAAWASRSPDAMRAVAIIAGAAIGGPLGAAIAIGGSLAANDRQRRLLNRRARADYEASLRDRQVTVRSAELPRSLCYGEVVVGGELVYGRAVGATAEQLMLVIALRPGHEIAAIDEVWWGERALGALDGNGYPTAAPFATTRNDVHTEQTATASGSATTVVTLTYTPVAGSVTAQYDTGSPGGDSGPRYLPLTVNSVAGNNVTLASVDANSAALPAGTALWVQYRRSETTAWLRCKRYLGAAGQTADADMIADSGGEWTSAHRGRGVPYLALWARYSEDVFPTGVENVKARIRGKRIYDPRTNAISNVGLAGAAVGTAPTGWVVLPSSGITPTIVGVGVEGGINYVDVRFNGTPSATSTTEVWSVPSATVAAAPGAVWRSAVCARLVGGSTAGLRFILTGTKSLTSGGALLDQGTASIAGSLTADPLVSQRYLSGAHTMPASTAYVVQQVAQVGFTSGVAIDITLRIGLPMLWNLALIPSAEPYDALAYSRNPALVARDYLTSILGFGCGSSEIDDASVIAAANVCDEEVNVYTTGTISGSNGSTAITGSGTAWTGGLAGCYLWAPNGVRYDIARVTSATELVLTTAYGGTTFSGAAYDIRQRRYRCDTELTTANARDANLEVILRSMAGWACYSQGTWKIYAGAYSSPSVTLDESALADGPINVQSRVARRDLFNYVKGVYVSPANNWQATDYPPVSNATYEAQDGGERLELDFALPATTNAYMAQRLAKIELEAGRQALTVQATFNLKAYRIAPGDTIGLTLARYGWSNKAFRVIDREFGLATGVRLTLREEASGIYDWNLGEATAVDLAPNSSLPDPFAVPTMNAITLASGGTHMLVSADGSVRPRIRASWTALTDARVTQGGAIEIEWQALPAGAWVREPDAPGDAALAYIAGVVEGHVYTVRARARNALGVRSAWQYATHTVAGDTTAPAQPTTFTVTEQADGARVYTWTQNDTPLDLAGFEIRYVSGGSGTWESMTLLATAEAGQRRLESTALAAGTWTFAIKAFDWTGNYSASARFANGVVLAGAGGVVQTPGIAPGAATTLFEYEKSAYKGDSSTDITTSYTQPGTAMQTVASWSYTPSVDCTLIVSVDATLRNLFTASAGNSYVVTNAIGVQAQASLDSDWDNHRVDVQSVTTGTYVGSGPATQEVTMHANQTYSLTAGVAYQIAVGAAKWSSASSASQRRVKIVVQAILR